MISIEGRYSPSMALKTIAFRLPEEKLQALDSVAEGKSLRDFFFNL
jgi:hypothetical protein